MKQIINTLLRIFRIHRWEYYYKKLNVNIIGRIEEVNMLHRKCKITGLNQIEHLPRVNGIRSFIEYKSTDISDIREDKINQILK